MVKLKTIRTWVDIFNIINIIIFIIINIIINKFEKKILLLLKKTIDFIWKVKLKIIITKTKQASHVL
jgi:hypothetical protein